MRKYIYIGIGAFLGAALRFWAQAIPIGESFHVYFGTLLINIAGCFLLALILTAAFEVWELDPSIRLGLTTGFLGAFTTFSALCKQTTELLFRGDYYLAAAYLTLCAMLGLGAVYAGVIAARLIARISQPTKKEM